MNILTKRQYTRALKLLDTLIKKDPSVRSLEGRTLTLLADIVFRHEEDLITRGGMRRVGFTIVSSEG